MFAGNTKQDDEESKNFEAPPRKFSMQNFGKLINKQMLKKMKSNIISEYDK